MRNLNYITCVEIDEFNLIKNAKYLVARRILDRLQPSLVSDYNIYLLGFNTIQSIGPSPYKGLRSYSLRSCYNSSTNALANLKSRITSSQTVEFQNTCPYCLYFTNSTFDHYIPKDEYPVYSVLPKNLIPCCSTCNSIKNDNWREAGKRLFIHFYNDIILNVQFLFGNLTFSHTTPIITFDLIHSPGITLTAFNLVSNHFRILRLIKLYNFGIPQIISNIKIDVDALRNAFGSSLTDAQIVTFLSSKSNKLKRLYGINYWQAIAIDLLANSPVFISSL